MVPEAVSHEFAEEGLEILDILAAYVALFNSTAFIRLLSIYSPNVAGGQFDLSWRHVAPIFVPNLYELSLDPKEADQYLTWRCRGALLI